jgi:hypothetical protein
MKKAMLLVVLFLFGMTTQTFSQRHQNTDRNPGKDHRYYNAQEIRFVENGVLYAVRTDGTFHFKTLQRAREYTYGRRAHNTVYYPSAPGQVVYTSVRRPFEPNIRTNRYGQIVRVGETLITYNRFGQVRSIGCVPLKYHKGNLKQVGDLKLKYDHHGLVRKTHGYVNGYNKKYWHEDWYINNNDQIIYHDRLRKRK